MNYTPPYPAPPPGYWPDYLRGDPPRADPTIHNYYAPRYGGATREPSPRRLPTGQGHARRASHAVPPLYSYTAPRGGTSQYTPEYASPRYSATPQRIPEFVPIYEVKSRSNRPRRASQEASRIQPLLQSKRLSTTKNNDNDVSSEYTSSGDESIDAKRIEREDDRKDPLFKYRTAPPKRHKMPEIIERGDDEDKIPVFKHSNSSLADIHVPRVKPQRSYTDPSRDRLRPRISLSSREKDADLAMLAWFPPSPATPIAARKPFSEVDLRGISDVLRRIGRGPWSRVPRIYATLRIIDKLSEIDCFLTEELSDVSFPFNNKTLPTSLKCQAARSNFLEAQKLVLTKGLDLERENGKHRHFSNSEDIPLQRIADLGKGGFSYVDHVLSTITYKEYARKLIPRGRTFRGDKEVLKSFERELATLKRLSHKHVVELVGSYTDTRYVGIIMSPVADCNLKQFLCRDPLPPESRSFIPTFFGCLTSALKYLHENCIRHRDIKPQNVLVKSHRVFLTDFGISRDWTELGHSTTEGPATKTLRYCAPEVAAERPRNSSSDVWSLGCVFLEIWSVLCRETLPKLTAHMESSGSYSSHYYQNTEAISSWCDLLRSKSGDEGSNRPYVWITSMLKETPDERWIVQYLFDCIQETNADPNVLLKFSDHCCIDEDDVSEDVQSSDFEHDHTDTTKVPGVMSQGRAINTDTNRQRCYNCKAMVQREEDCNHTICRCTAQFCHECALPWKTCNCPWFEYHKCDSECD